MSGGWREVSKQREIIEKASEKGEEDGGGPWNGQREKFIEKKAREEGNGKWKAMKRIKREVIEKKATGKNEGIEGGGTWKG